MGARCALLLVTACSGCGEPCRRTGTQDFYARLSSAPDGDGGGFPRELTGSMGFSSDGAVTVEGVLGQTRACTATYESYPSERCALFVACDCDGATGCLALHAGAAYAAHDEVTNGTLQAIEMVAHRGASYQWSIAPKGDAGP